MRFPLAAGVAASVAMSVIGGSHTASAAPSSTDWTQWGFNAQHTGDNPAETVLARANVGHLVSAFSSRLNDTYPDPIVAGGVVYLSSSGSGHVEAINGATGAVNWRATPVCAGQQTSDPAFANGRIWIGLEDPGVAAISANGNKVICAESSLVQSPPSAGHGSVYTSDEFGGLEAYNAATGALRWSIDLPQGGPYYIGSPAVSADGSAVFIGDGTDYVDKVNAATGAVIWSRYLDACDVDNSTVAVSGSMLFVTGCGVYGLSAATGSIVWRESALTGDVSAPAVAGSLVYAAGEGATPGLAAFNASNGSLVWDDLEYQGEAPTIANGVLYVDDADYTTLGTANAYALNEIAMLNSSTGALLGVLSPPHSNDVFYGAVIPVDGRVYACTYNTHYEGGFGYPTSLRAYEPRS